MRLSRRFHHLPLVLAIGLLAVQLAGCRRGPQPTPTATPLPPSPTATLQVATPAPVPTTLEGWLEHQTPYLSIWLPLDWEVLDLSSDDLQAIFARLEQSNPTLARIIGSPENLQGTLFWGVRQMPATATFADNLNIRRTPLNGQVLNTMAEVVNPVVAQYRELGFTVTATDPNLTIGGHMAARIAYSFPFYLLDGGQTHIEGRQYLIATPTDLWILSFSAGPDTVAALTPVFEQSAQSFRAR
ncbi:MAG: hypothetical protein ACUVSS_06505 [Anaerolineae bacterium]